MLIQEVDLIVLVTKTPSEFFKLKAGDGDSEYVTYYFC